MTKALSDHRRESLVVAASETFLLEEAAIRAKA